MKRINTEKYKAKFEQLFMKKKCRTELARKNLNLAFGEGEFGEVSENIRRDFALKSPDNNFIRRFFKKLVVPQKVFAILMPITMLMTFTILSEGILFGTGLWLSLLIAASAFIHLWTIKKLAGDKDKNLLENTMNSKVTLGDGYLEYSYSTIEPFRTERDKKCNYVLYRISYRDIKGLIYDEKRDSCTIVGKYTKYKYYNYRIGDEKPVYTDVREEDCFEIFNIYRDRDLFANISKNAHVPLTQSETRVKKQSKVGALLLSIILTFTDLSSFLGWIILLLVAR